MKKTQSRKQLILSRQTLRFLQAPRLQHVVGGTDSGPESACLVCEEFKETAVC